MPKRALDEDNCVDGGSDEADGMLPPSVIISSSSTEPEMLRHVSGNDDDDDEYGDDADGQSVCSGVMESSASDETSLPTDGSTDTADPCPATHRVKKSVSFDDVTVYYFPRVQGFTCVPSQGGSTLGMGDRHTSVEKYSLSEHAQIRQALHHKILLEHQCQGRIFLPENFASDSSVASEWALDEYYFLQPVQARQRRAILREAGVARIDPTEREECRSLRLSRGRCGCLCREVCRPPSCACCRAGIGCQVDQMAFPCSCSRSGCANPHGRVEFNAARVRAHFIRTLLQLGLEQNAANEYDTALPPPAKRCCLDSDQPSMSLSSSFTSSSPLLVNSSGVDTASVAVTNGIEPQTVYFDSVEGLPGPDTMVVAYDEDCEDNDDDSSSDTSSDGGARYDVILGDADDCQATATMLDSRQRTLDNYIVRFSRHHTYCDAGLSNCSFAGSLQLGAVASSSLNAPLSCTVTCQSLTPHCHPSVVLRAETTHNSSLPVNDGHFCYMPNDSRHAYALPDGTVHSHSTSEAVSDNYSVSLAATLDTQRYFPVDNVRCDVNTTGYLAQQEVTDRCSTEPSAAHSHTVSDNTPTSSHSTQGTSCFSSTVDDTKQSCWLMDDTLCKSCPTAGDATMENTSRGSCMADTQHCTSTCGLSVADSDMQSYCAVDDNATTYTDNKNSVPINTGSESDAALYYSIHDHTHTCSTADKRTSGRSVSQVITCGYNTTGDIIEFSKIDNDVHESTTDDAACSYAAPPNTSYYHSAQVSTENECFVPHPVTPSYSLQDNTVYDNSKMEDTTHSSLMPDDDMPGVCSPDDTVLESSSMLEYVSEEHAPDDGSTVNNTHDSSELDTTVHSHSFLGDAMFSHSATCTDIITHSYLMSESATDNDFVPDDGSMQKDQRHGNYMSENGGNCCASDGYSTQLNCGLGSDGSVITDVAELSQCEQKGDCVSSSDCLASCLYSEEIVTAYETVSDISDVIALSSDMSSEHSTMQMTATQSDALCQPCSALSCVSSSHQNSVVKSRHSVADDMTTTHECSQTGAYFMSSSFSQNDGPLTTVHTSVPSSTVAVADQLVAQDSSASDFWHVSNTSCHIEGLEDTCDVSSVTSVLICPDENHVMNSTLDIVSVNSEHMSNTDYDKRDVELTAAVTSTVDNRHVGHRNSVVAAETVSSETRAAECEDTSDTAC